MSPGRMVMCRRGHFFFTNSEKSPGCHYCLVDVEMGMRGPLVEPHKGHR